MSKKNKTRQEVLALLESQKCISAYSGLVDNAKVTTEYAKIPTEEIIIRLYKYGYKALNCGQQRVRRDEKKYLSDPAYRAQIDLKQRSAKHWVLLHKSDNSPYRILVMNAHRGSMACKLYFGIIMEGADLNGVQFNELISFTSLKHTHDNALHIVGIIDGFVDSIKQSMQIRKNLEKLIITPIEFEKQLRVISAIPKKPLVSENELVRLYDQIPLASNTNLARLMGFCTQILVNHFVQNRRTVTIAGLATQAQLAVKIREYVVELYNQATQ